MSTQTNVLMTDRLTLLLQADLCSLEAMAKDNDPSEGTQSATAIKGRVDALSLITRTLEKLLELRRLEILTRDEASAQDEAETVRLREDLMRRLRAVDARRAGGPGLFPAEPA